MVDNSSSGGAGASQQRDDGSALIDEDEYDEEEAYREEIKAMRFRNHVSSFDIDLDTLLDKPWNKVLEH